MPTKTTRRSYTAALLIETTQASGRQAFEGAADYFALRPRFNLEFVQTCQHANIRDWLKKWKGDGLVVLHDDEVIEAIADTDRPFVDLNPWSASVREFWVGTSGSRRAREGKGANAVWSEGVFEVW